MFIVFLKSCAVSGLVPKDKQSPYEKNFLVGYFNKESRMSHQCTSAPVCCLILPNAVQSVNFFGFQEVEEIMKPNFFSRVKIAAMVFVTLSGFLCPVSHFYLFLYV